MADENQKWWLYLIRMANGNLYCGVTTDVQRRFLEHSGNSQKTAKALRNKGPLKLVCTYSAGSKQQAMQLEYRLKQWTKKRKEQLIMQPETIKMLLLELEVGK